jgi:hypothetical protein
MTQVPGLVQENLILVYKFLFINDFFNNDISTSDVLGAGGKMINE